MLACCRNLNKKKVLGYAELAMLVISLFSFAYIINQGTIVEAQEGTGTLLDLPGEASASTCIERSDGAICQEGIAEGNEEQCPGGWIPTSKDQVLECTEGCCYDEGSGIATPKTSRYLCDREGGEWTEDPACGASEYRLGCCVLGSDTEFVTQRTCELLTESRELELDYRIVGSENECLALAHLQDRGACIIGGIVDEGTICTHKT